MKRVLMYIDSLGSGGAQRQFVGLAKMLAEHDYVVKILTYYPENFFGEEVRHLDYECLEDEGHFLRRLTNLHKVTRSFQPEVVISFLSTPCIVTSLLKVSGLKFKLIVSERSLTQKLNFKNRWKFFLYRFADVIVPNSYSQKEYICHHYPRYVNKTFVIPNFVDLDKFKSHKPKHRSVQNEILVVASICEIKNTLLLIDAAHQLKRNGYSFVIHWYGLPNIETDYVKRCRELIDKLELSSVFKLCEKVTNIEEKYRDADYFCLPSSYEGTANVLCEAISCSLPVVCSDVSDNGKYVLTGVNGFLFDPTDVNDAVQAMSSLLKCTEEEYNNYSIESRKIAEKNLSVNSFINKYINILRKF